jgi:small subunit ribosomal protein S18
LKTENTSRDSNRPASSGDSADRPRTRPMMRAPIRKKSCRFCADHVSYIDYKAFEILRNYVTDRGKMISGRSTGNCSKHQRQMTVAIRRARNLALLPYSMI